MKKLLLTIVGIGLCIGAALFAQPGTVLQPGQIGIVGFNSDEKLKDNINESSFAFILLVDIQANTEILFTDKGWDNSANGGAGGFVTAEQVLLWTSTSFMPAGSIVIIEADAGAAPVGGEIIYPASGGGTLTGQMLLLDANGDQIFILQTTGPIDLGSGAITLLGGLNINGRWNDNANVNNNNKSHLPTALNPGSLIGPLPFILDFETGNPKNGIFSGNLTGTAAQIILQLNTAANWTVGKNPIDLLNLLPIELTDFRVRRVDEGVLLEWRTASELNNDFMAVEHSGDGKGFSEIGRVRGRGTTYEAQYYAFVDKRPLPGINYYRLRQVDFDGTTTVHKVVTIVVDRRSDGPRVFPTVANEQVLVQLDQPAFRGQLRVVDLHGRVLRSESWPEGGRQFRLDVQWLPPGAYLLQLQLDGRQSPALRFVRL